MRVNDKSPEPRRDSDNNQHPTNGQPNQDPNFLSNPTTQRILIGVVLVLILAITLVFMDRGNRPTNEVSLTELARSVREGAVISIQEVNGVDLYITYEQGGTAIAYKNPNVNLFELLNITNVADAPFQYSAELTSDSQGIFLQILLFVILPFIVVGYLAYDAFRTQ
jgi:hypothetical protein